MIDGDTFILLDAASSSSHLEARALDRLSNSHDAYGILCEVFAPIIPQFLEQCPHLSVNS